MLGNEAAIGAAAVAAAFELLNRAVDATGLPVGRDSRRNLADVVAILEMDHFPHADLTHSAFRLFAGRAGAAAPGSLASPTTGSVELFQLRPRHITRRPVLPVLRSRAGAHLRRLRPSAR